MSLQAENKVYRIELSYLLWIEKFCLLGIKLVTAMSIHSMFRFYITTYVSCNFSVWMKKKDLFALHLSFFCQIFEVEVIRDMILLSLYCFAFNLCNLCNVYNKTCKMTFEGQCIVSIEQNGTDTVIFEIKDKHMFFSCFLFVFHSDQASRL